MMAPRFTCWNEREGTTRNLPSAWGGESVGRPPTTPAYTTGAPSNARVARPGSRGTKSSQTRSAVPSIEIDDEELARRLVGRDHRAVAEHAGVHDRRAVERASRAAGVTRHEIIPDPKRGAVDRNRRRGIELPFDERHVLEVAARIAGRLQPQPLEFGGDVRGRLEIVFAAGEATHHRIVGVQIQPGHEIGGRDRGLGARGRVLERQRSLRACLSGDSNAHPDGEKTTYLHGTVSEV